MNINEMKKEMALLIEATDNVVEKELNGKLKKVAGNLGKSNGNQNKSPASQKALSFYNSIILPTLDKLNVSNKDIAALLLGTAIQESLLIFREQLSEGPAIGLFQMEPSTHNDIWENFLKYKPILGEKLLTFLPDKNSDKLKALKNNDKYAAAMSYVHYLRRGKGSFPSRKNVDAMASFWKTHYNTSLGGGTTEEFITKWNKVIGNIPLP